MVNCAVLSCKSSCNAQGHQKGNVSFHTFPKAPELKEKWIDATGNINWFPTKYSKICSLHFDQNSFLICDKQRRLKHTAYPTIAVLNVVTQESPSGKSLREHHNAPDKRVVKIMPRQPIIQIPCSSEALIEQVKKRPGLWGPEYSSEREARKVLWMEVAKEVEPSFDTLNSYEERELESNLRKRWRSLRDSYKREKREQYMDKVTTKNGKRKAQFAYFDLLRFVDEHLDDREMNMDESDSKFVDNQEENAMYGGTSTVTIEVPPKKQLKKHARIQKVQKRVVNDPSTSEDEDILGHTESIYTESITETDNFDNGTKYGDTDKMFLLSFLPELKQLPTNLKMWARMKISSIMQEAVSLNMVETPEINVEVKTECDSE